MTEADHTSTGPLCARLIELCDDAASAADGQSAVELASVRGGLAGPLRVALAGRVSSGKSTIVNALVGHRIGATDVGECTRIVTWYHFGAHERAQLTRRDGTVAALQLESDGSLPARLGEDPAGVARIDVWLSSSALERIIIIDTPGLGSLTGASGATEQLLALDASSRIAISQADALLFVMSGELHEDDVAVLDAFKAMMTGIRTSTINVIGLLNKVDLIGGGAPNAIALGRARAEKLARVLRTSVATVLPLVGLLAETTETAALSGEHTRMLSALAVTDAVERDLALLSVDRFLTSPMAIPVPLRKDLIRRLDITGLRAAVELLAGGSDVALLLAELRDRSGIRELAAALDGLFANRADALKAEWGIACLERLTGTAFPAAMAGRIEEVLADPRMHTLQELRALQQANAADGTLPPGLMDELLRLVSSDTLRGRLGVAPAASMSDCQEAAVQGSRRWAEVAGTGQSGIVVRRVAAVMRRSFDLMWQQAAQEEAMV